LKKEQQNKVCIISLGCPKNLVDSEVMGGLLRKAGYQLVQDHDHADIAIVNTCAFINPAKEESIEEILRLAEAKKKNNPQMRIMVAGCLAQRHGQELFSQLPEVDLFMGTGEIGHIVHHIKKLHLKTFQRQSVISPASFLMNAQYPRMLVPQAASAYLKISDGCSNHCSYCIIPAVRGPARSRTPDDILREAESLAKRGIKEIIITAQDTTSYGRDLKKRPLLSALLGDMTTIKGIQWIRLLYAHPLRITSDLLKIMAVHDKICKYLDLPVQHIDDDILKMMNRKVTGNKIRNVIAQCRREIPTIALRTSLIVGFPGETRAKFNQLLNFVRKIKFDHLGVFLYSREEGTKAARLKVQVPEKEKERRRESIMYEQAAISAAINKTLIGTVQEILIEEESDRKDYDFIGRIRRQAPGVDGVTYIQGRNLLPGSIVQGKITAADEYDLFGKMIAFE
jgi:ribosomal protein S12 methylthiotransferase